MIITFRWWIVRRLSKNVRENKIILKYRLGFTKKKYIYRFMYFIIIIIIFLVIFIRFLFLLLLFNERNNKPQMTIISR